jgi:hypothetical protein
MLYKLDYLRKTTLNDKELIEEIINLFIDLIDEDSILILESFETGNYTSFKKLIHKLKPHIYNFQIEDLYIIIEYLNNIESFEFDTNKTQLKVQMLINFLKRIKNQLIVNELNR